MHFTKKNHVKNSKPFYNLEKDTRKIIKTLLIKKKFDKILIANFQKS